MSAGPSTSLLDAPLCLVRASGAVRVRSVFKGCPQPRLVNRTRRLNTPQHALLQAALIAPVLVSGVRCASLDQHANQRSEGWDALPEDRFKYKHTLYPQRMIGVFRDAIWYPNPPRPPSRSLGIHAAHIFLGNDPLTIQGCNIVRSRGFPEAALMLVEDKQAR
jgi:hypothetical protein